MALPFKKEASISASVPNESIKRKPDHEEEYDPLDSAMDEFHKASKSGDLKAMGVAFRSAFQLLESEPHEEYEHMEGES